MENFDLIVIGAGPGGYETAVEAAKVYNMKVAIVEKGHMGGTCLNRGCIPTKTLLHASGMYQKLKSQGERIGITKTEHIGYNLQEMQLYKENVLNHLRLGISALMRTNKISVYNGIGTIRSKNKVHIALNDGSECDIEAKYVLIATGSVPLIPSLPGAELEGVITSDQLLQLNKPITDLAIIGGGVIGCEFAAIFSSLGVKVTIIEALGRILANMDREISQSLKMQMKRTGLIDIHTGAKVSKITRHGESVVCHFTEKDEEMSVTSQYVLMAIGRKAYTNALLDSNSDGEISAIAMENGKINVDENYQTSVDGVYAIGDAIGGIQLAHVAVAEGRNAVAAMNNATPVVDMETVPSCIYTEPEIASTGLSSEALAEKGIETITKKYPMNANGKSVLELQERGFIKVTADAETHKVLSAQMMCARASDMISIFSQAIVNNLTLEDMSQVIYPHPTFCEGIGEAVR